MMQQKLLVGFLFFFWGQGIISCQLKQQETSSKQKLTPQQTFLQKGNWLEDDSLFQCQLDSLQVNAWQVYLHCQKEKDQQKKLRLISSISQAADNYINYQDSSYWGGILYRMKPFAELIERLKEPQHRSFIDIGSGNGEKLYAALCLGFEQTHGLEYDTTLVGLSQNHWRALIDRKKMHIQLGNALTIAPVYYHSFDFIYLYSPIRNHHQMARLFFTLMQQLKEGGVLLEVRMVYAEELRKVSGYAIPHMMGTFALKKQRGKLYYVQYSESTKDWILLKKHRSSDVENK